MSMLFSNAIAPVCPILCVYVCVPVLFSNAIVTVRHSVYASVMFSNTIVPVRPSVCVPVLFSNAIFPVRHKNI